MSSPLARLAKVPFGWVESYCRICSLLVGLIKGVMSSMWDDACLFPLEMGRSRKFMLLVELSWVNLIVGWNWLRYSVNLSSSAGVSVQRHRMSSMYVCISSRIMALWGSLPGVFLLVLP